MTIQQEPVSNIRRGQRYFRNRGRVGRGEYTPGVNNTGAVNRRCYYCALNFTLDHIANCPAKGVTCNACQKVVRFERTCRGVRRGTNHWRGREPVVLVRDENEHHRSTHSVDNIQ